MTDRHEDKGYIYLAEPSKWKQSDTKEEDTHEPFNPLLDDLELGAVGDYLATIERATETLRETQPPIIHELWEYESKTQHPLDIKYPHKCWGCGVPMSWYELLETNCLTFNYECGLPNYPNHPLKFMDNAYDKYKHFKKLWRSKIIQLYCCTCFEKVEERGNKE